MTPARTTHPLPPLGALALAACVALPACGGDGAAPASVVEEATAAQTPGGGAPPIGPGQAGAGTVDLLPGGTRVLPLGDSITVGLGATGGYRLPLWSRLQAAEVPVDLVGRQTAGSPEFFVDPEHEGHVGWRVQDLIQFDGQGLAPDSSIEAILEAAQPATILLHAGTNDMLSYEAWHQAPKRLSVLLDRIRAFDPGIGVFVATIVPTADPSTNLGVAWYRERVVELVHARALAGHAIGLVDMGAELSDLVTVDGIHPGPEGYGAMADQWFEALTDRTPSAPPLEPGPPVVPGVSALASSFFDGHLPSLAVNGAGLQGGLHDDVEPGVPLGWRSAPFAQQVGEDGIGLPQEPSPVFLVRLPGLVDVQGLQVWNGRNLSTDGLVWGNVESIRSVRVDTQGADGQWTPRGQMNLTRGMARSLAPSEELDVDWPAVRAIRLRVTSTYGTVGGVVGPLIDAVSISELRVLGTPSE